MTAEEEEEEALLMRALPVDMSRPLRVGVGVQLAPPPQSASDLVVVSIAPRMAIDSGDTGTAVLLLAAFGLFFVCTEE